MFVVGGSALVPWLAGTPASFRADPSSRVSTSTPARANDSLDFPPIVRLHDWRQRSATTGRGKRDIFTFRAPERSAAKHPEQLFLHPAEPVPAAAIPLKLIGMAQNTGEDAEAATAIIAGQGQVYLVKQGDLVAGTYTVGTVSADNVELIDLAKGGNLCRRHRSPASCGRRCVPRFH